MVVPGSVEHIERCMLGSSSTLPVAERLNVLIEAVILHRNEAGLKTAHVPDPKATASRVTGYLNSQGRADWPLQELEDVSIPSVSFYSQTTSTDAGSQNSLVGVGAGLKRHMVSFACLSFEVIANFPCRRSTLLIRSKQSAFVPMTNNCQRPSIHKTSA